MQVAKVLEADPFVESRAVLEQVIDELRSGRVMRMTHAEVEELADARGCDLIRQLFQDHLDLRSAEEVQLECVKGSDGVERTHVRSRSRPLETRFGTVRVNRLTYGADGESSLSPLDAALNLPEEKYSHGVRRRAAIEASKGSFDEVVEALHTTTGAKVAKRQVEELVRRAAVDFELYYTMAELQRPVDLNDLVVLTFDGKGIVVRKAAERQKQKLKKRLSKGEKRHRKRMTTVAAVYDLEPHPRKPEDVIADDPEAKKVRRSAPRAENKRVWASVRLSPEEVIEAGFQEALLRDPYKKRRWVVLVDGNEDQLGLVQKVARRHRVRVTIILDVIHVLEYLWKAGHCFHGEGTPELEAWVTERFLAILEGRASGVAAGMRRSATRRGLSRGRRKAVDTCAGYLLKHKKFLRYDRYLRKGFPIATGVIEGACRHLVKDRMEITGARWSLDGAEAVLRLRALRSSGDFDTYWCFHLAQEHERTHALHYAAAVVPGGKPRLRVIRGGASS